MEVMLCVPKGTNIDLVKREYPDIYQDEGWDDHDRYFIGSPSGEEGADEFMDYEECVKFCGFAEGAIMGADALIDGNGEWAQGKVTEMDAYKQSFVSGKAVSR